MSRIWSDEGDYLTHYGEKIAAAEEKTSAVKAVLSASQMRRQLEQWARNNPVQASYDNDGNPIERSN